MASEHEEEIVGVWTGMPDELALHFHDHDVAAIELGDDFRRPTIGKRGEFICEANWLLHRSNLRGKQAREQRHAFGVSYAVDA
jgi:hypothetical protein